MPPRPPVGRATKAAALALLLMVALTAATAPRAGITRLLTVGTTPASARVLSADALFVTDFNDGQADDSVLRRYALDGGAQQWSTRLPESARGLRLRSGVLLTRNADESTTAVDAGTGAVLWRSAGSVTDLTPDAALVVRYAPDRRSAVLRLLALRTGALVWARPIATNATWRILSGTAPEAGPRRVVVIAENGDTTTFRFDTGATVAQAALRLTLREWEGNYREDYSGDFTEISGIGDGLYVVTGHDGTTTLTAYDADTLTVRWRSPGVPPGRADDCGAVLCVVDLSVLGADPAAVAADREIVAVDPATGARRWRVTGWRTASALSRDRLLATADTGDAAPARAVLDAATGRVVVALGGGDVLAVTPGAMRFVHPDTARGDRLWVSTVDLRTGRSSPVGSVERATRACDAVGVHLACAVAGGPFAVWRLPGGD